MKVVHTSGVLKQHLGDSLGLTEVRLAASTFQMAHVQLTNASRGMRDEKRVWG